MLFTVNGVGMGWNCAIGLVYGLSLKADGCTQDQGHSFFSHMDQFRLGKALLFLVVCFFLPLPDWCGDDSQPRLMGFESMISQSHLRSLIATHWDASGKKFKPIPIKSYQTVLFVSLLREFWSGFIETKPQWSLQPIGTQRRITRNQ